jgi:lipopolysaccharide export LptBFGC system permease protein LptF
MTFSLAIALFAFAFSLFVLWRVNKNTRAMRNNYKLMLAQLRELDRIIDGRIAKKAVEAVREASERGVLR